MYVVCAGRTQTTMANTKDVRERRYSWWALVENCSLHFRHFRHPWRSCRVGQESENGVVTDLGIPLCRNDNIELHQVFITQML